MKKKAKKTTVKAHHDMDLHQSMFVWSILALGIVSFICWVLAMYVGMNS